MSGFADPIVDGGGRLQIASVQSPNYVPGGSGWAINQDGTAQFNQLTLIVSVSGVAVLIYNQVAALGTLIGSWAGAPGTDQFGNVYPAGISANQGALSGISLDSATITNAILTTALLNGPTITSAAMLGGTITETAITFDSTGGVLFGYSTTTTTVIQTVNGTYNFLVPAGVTQAKIECWGAGAGGGGGNAGGDGGPGGGGGEYAQEPAYPLTPGLNYTYTVGAGGNGGNSGSGGGDGGDSFFDAFGPNGGVRGNGGNGGNLQSDAGGGTGSTNTIHHDGGSGGASGGNNGGGGGGGSAGATGSGGTGASATGNSGAAGGSAGSGGGAAGGGGGNNGANGTGGAAPGAGGGGAGMGSSVNSFTKTYRVNNSGNGSRSGSFFGSDAAGGAPPNGLRDHNPCYQGGETAGGGSFNGTQRSMFVLPNSVQSDLAGATITQVTFRLTNQHSWFNSGMTVALNYDSNGSLPGSYSGGATNIGTYSINEGQTKTFSLPKVAVGNALKSGAAKCFTIGSGPNFNLSYYGFFTGDSGDNDHCPMLSVSGTTGTGSNSAGDGADGQVKITYTSGTVLTTAVSAVAGTDANLNQFAAGFTGQITALQPGVAPSIPETWHSTGALSNSWARTGGFFFYRLTAENELQLSATIIGPSASTVNNVTIFTFPVGYRPLSNHSFPVASSILTASNTASPQMTLTSGGVLTSQAVGGNPGSSTVSFEVKIPLGV